MQEVSLITQVDGGLVTDTGSPHYIRLVSDLQTINVPKEGAAIRYAPEFSPGGLNVNFVSKQDPTHYQIRTYERGVENETLACGTGAVAAAIAMHSSGETEGATEVCLTARGGILTVSFELAMTGHYHKIFICKGPPILCFFWNNFNYEYLKTVSLKSS